MRKKSFQNQNLLYKYYRKFNNLQRRIKLLMQNGEFYELSHDLRNRMIRRLKLLYGRIVRLAGKQKLKWAGVALAMILSASVAMAGYQDPVRMSGFLTQRLADPVFVDLDSDGDLDIVVGDIYGGITYYENGDNGYQEAEDNPFESIDVGDYASPTFADVDDDGDLDMVVGDYDGILHYFENASGTFTEVTGAGNPWDGEDVGLAALPSFADVDDDGDPDLLVGDFYGTISYYENNSSSFTPQTGGDNPFDGIDVGARSSAGMVDLDEDGDLDLYVGEKYGTIIYFENDGGAYTELTGTDNPFNGIDIDEIALSPVVTNLDGDDDFDIIAGDLESGILRYFENDGGSYAEQRGTNNPLEGITVASSMAPAFVDLDDDSDLDIVAGAGDGTVNYFRNDGDVILPLKDTDNPFNGIDVGSSAKISMGDVDDDGDLDLVIGEYDGIIHYFAAEVGSYVELTGASNPFDGIDVGEYSGPALVDFDDDGDLDLFVSEKYGTISYYRNVSGTYVQQTGTDNPFDGVDVGDRPALLFVDYDSDGDMDVFVGEKYGSLFYFENNEGVLTELTDYENPANGLVLGGTPAPAIADLDGDGDLDIYAGNSDGDFAFSEFIPASIYIDQGSGLTTTEAGGTSLFTVVLESQPGDDVEIAVSSSNTNEGTVNPALLTFTPTDWDEPQLVTVTGVDDTEDDGDQAYSIDFSVTSSDLEYDGMAITSLSATNSDNDEPDANAIESNTFDDINVFAHDHIVILETGDMRVDKAEIYSITGTMIISVDVHTSGHFEIPIYGVSDGIYIVHVFGNNEITTTKVYIR